jgi:hypothetical protein
MDESINWKVDHADSLLRPHAILARACGANS